jgi:hypothetical protein
MLGTLSCPMASYGASVAIFFIIISVFKTRMRRVRHNSAARNTAAADFCPKALRFDVVAAG